MERVERHLAQSPSKNQTTNSRFMQRSGTMQALNSDLKARMGLMERQNPSNLESYVNKPLRAAPASVIQMEKQLLEQASAKKYQKNGPAETEPDQAKLPTLNRYNVRQLD